jgi:pilus assembly protein CpaE
MRGAFECTVVDLPRNMLVNHPHLITDVQVAVLVTELTLAAARDAIRILSWFKSNAPQTQVIVVANKVQPQAVLEISRKDFEGSIERKIDFVLIPFEQKVAAQAAKLGKPLAEAGKSAKSLAPARRPGGAHHRDHRFGRARQQARQGPARRIEGRIAVRQASRSRCPKAKK